MKNLSTKIPQQITISNIAWYNDIIKNRSSEKNINRKHKTFTDKVDMLFTKYEGIILKQFKTLDNLETAEWLNFLDSNKDVETLDRNLVSFALTYIKNELSTLMKIESEIDIDRDIKTFRTVFNSRTLGYTKTFFKELQKSSGKKTFNTIQDIIKAAKKVIPNNVDISGIEGISEVLSDNTVSRRKTTLTYWQKLVVVS